VYEMLPNRDKTSYLSNVKWLYIPS